MSESSRYESVGTPRVSTEFLRLRWEISSDISRAVRVLDKATDGGSVQRPYVTYSADGIANIHPVSSAPITQPPVSLIRVSIDEPNYWGREWARAQEHNTDSNKDKSSEQAFADDADENAVARRPNFPCGDPRSGSPLVLELKASAQDFVTIHEYISAIHPWLLLLAKDRIKAKDDSGAGTTPIDPKPLFVSPLYVTPLVVVDIDPWLGVVDSAQLSTCLVLEDNSRI
ncbi:hypothetical protein HIM_11902 [Hirsutella minnesotensis 3608]|uniref:Uncharacterized protein n=1 Tax=Hirsutella minnesotensis 3608 TaxID=1043627 RepID=A0A0F7ZF87_9HYPO|nr:hypothetical protein HIM_11902 [Hirsutella minnesotensis 3608]